MARSDVPGRDVVRFGAALAVGSASTVLGIAGRDHAVLAAASAAGWIGAIWLARVAKGPAAFWVAAAVVLALTPALSTVRWWLVGAALATSSVIQGYPRMAPRIRVAAGWRPRVQRVVFSGAAWARSAVHVSWEAVFLAGLGALAASGVVSAFGADVLAADLATASWVLLVLAVVTASVASARGRQARTGAVRR